MRAFAQATVVSSFDGGDGAESLIFTCGPDCGVGVRLSISTADNWNTAFVDYFITKNTGDTSWVILQSPGNLRKLGGDASVFEDTGSLQWFPNSLPQSNRAVFLMGLEGGPIWEALSNGLSIQNYYFGNEYLAGATLMLPDRSRASYSYRLWGGQPSVEIVPVPGAALNFGLLALFGAYMSFRKRRPVQA